MPDQSVKHERFAFYDRESDIVWLPTGPLGNVSGERTDWGVLSRDTENGAVVAIEIWSASERLPKDVLDAFPEPVPDASA